MSMIASSRYIGIKVLSLSNGDLPTAVAAYISRAELRSTVTGELFSHRHKASDLVWSEVILPKDVDESFKDPAILWPAMERAEIRRTPKRTGSDKQSKAEHAALLAKIDDPNPKRLTRDDLAPAWRENAQLGFHFILALPHPFSEEQYEALVRKFIEAELLPHGFICHVATHRPHDGSPLNWHAHILVAPRSVKGTKVGNKIRDVIATFGNTPKGNGFISPDSHWPDRWVACQEDFARSLGLDLRISPKSAIPQPHRGKTLYMSGTDHEEVWAEARAAATETIQIPGCLQELMVEGQSSFSPGEAREVLAEHRVPWDVADAMIEALRDMPDLLPLFDRDTGRFSGRFTIPEVREQEYRLGRLASALRQRRTVEEPHARLRQAAAELATKRRDQPVVAAVNALADPGRLGLIEGIASEDLEPFLLALNRICADANFELQVLAPTAGGACTLRQTLRGARTISGEFHRQDRAARDRAARKKDQTKQPGEGDKATTPRTPGRARRGRKRRKPSEVKPWSRRTCLVVADPDLVDGDAYEELLTRAQATGARLILLAPTTPRQSIGRSGAYAAVRAATISGDSATIRVLPALPGVAAADKRQPSTAFAAPGDRRAAGAGDTVGTPVLPPPRPWRWPSAGLTDIYNLSVRQDCTEVGRQMEALPAEEMFSTFRTLPSMANDGLPNPHPLISLRRQIMGSLRKRGISGITGRTDVDCLRWLGLRSDSWRDREDLAPRQPGQADVRPLLASITNIDVADWNALVERMAPFPVSVLRDIVGSLDELFKRARSDDVRYAISFARLQIYVMAKETGRDLVPQFSRDKLWSIISSAERLHSAVRYDDDEGTLAPILAATLPQPDRQEAISIADRPRTRSATPVWMPLPAWSPLGDYGVHPESGARRAHYLKIVAAEPAQRTEYQNKLLEIFTTCRDLAMRAWCAVGLQHIASWYRQSGNKMPVEVERADNAANKAVVDWRYNGGYRHNPFLAAREQATIERLARQLLAARERDRQLAVAEQIASLRRRPGAHPRFLELFDASQTPVNYLRTRNGSALDPAILGSLMAGLARALDKPTPSATPAAEPRTGRDPVMPGPVRSPRDPRQGDPSV